MKSSLLLQGNAACRLLLAPFNGTERKKRRIGDKRVSELERILDEIVNEIIVLEIYPRSEILVAITVFETDGYYFNIIISIIIITIIISITAYNNIITLILI